MQWTLGQIRQSFLDFFIACGHVKSESAPLIPKNDPSLLFVNAGMVPFKSYFLGEDRPDALRMCSVQRCLRAGGKHNDLENVGYTARHHTFFEMMGFFSFGDYFKKEAIGFAWRYLTEILQIPKERLWVSVYEEDDESFDIWSQDIGVDANRISRCGKKDNFWSMGETGPCGPCTEIFYDHGEEVAGGPPGSDEEDGDRYIEIWNLVFMQYNAKTNGLLVEPLPTPCVDTGMGLERLAAVLQGVHNNYDTDMFSNLIHGIRDVLSLDVAIDHHSLRVLADHLRSVAFLMIDGVMPGNEGRAYVLRRILRRALRHGVSLGCEGLFFYKLLPCLVKVMGSAYSVLVEKQAMIMQWIKEEEEKFSQTLGRGLQVLSAYLKQDGGVIAGDVVFKLYDTYGFPPDLSADVARESGMTIDYDGFERAMALQKERSSQRSHFKAVDLDAWQCDLESKFVGDASYIQDSVITGIFCDGKSVECLKSGQKGSVVVGETLFYPEGGGQVADVGIISSASGSFEVMDTQKKQRAIIHMGELTGGELMVGQIVKMDVDQQRQNQLRAHHSATHLLHAALRQVLGDQVVQKGSLVESHRIRFDFSFSRPVTEAELREIEGCVNGWIRMDVGRTIELCSKAQAKESGALALFDEKYDGQVRVVSFGSLSKELCGGLHVGRTGELSVFKIISESSCAQGVRRIEALTSDAALDYLEAGQQTLTAIAKKLQCSPLQVDAQIDKLFENLKEQERLIESFAKQRVNFQVVELAKKVVHIDGVNILAVLTDEGVGGKDLRQVADDMMTHLDGSSALVLASRQKEQRVAVIARVSPQLHMHFTARELLAQVLEPMGGRGGGRKDMAQGGCLDSEKLIGVLDEVRLWMQHHLI